MEWKWLELVRRLRRVLCGSPGNALRYNASSIGLRAGQHTIRVEALDTVSEGPPRVLWEGPGTPLADVPATCFFAPQELGSWKGNRFAEELLWRFRYFGSCVTSQPPPSERTRLTLAANCRLSILIAVT